MKVYTGLDQIRRQLPDGLKGRKAGILMHASSVDSSLTPVIDIIRDSGSCIPWALFGPQHGIYGQTQDNMIEWEGWVHPTLKIPVYSLYGEHRKPSQRMLEGLEVFIADLQDVGARLYTYIWTVKLCMEACAEAGIPFYILDRPNPIGRICADGPVLKDEYFTFVGGARIPMCHRMTIGEMALWLREKYIPGCELTVIKLQGWKRNSLFRDTGLPWVLPSPNMPTPETALVYPGTVLAEALNLSEGRGTVIPFELTGAPYINGEKLRRELLTRDIQGCTFRLHDFIPTFNKFAGVHCQGIQIHVTDPDIFRPVATALHLYDAIIKTSPAGSLTFNPPPYEYEYDLMPFDILSGDSRMREVLLTGASLDEEIERWDAEIEGFNREFREIALYRD